MLLGADLEWKLDFSSTGSAYTTTMNVLQLEKYGTEQHTSRRLKNPLKPQISRFTLEKLLGARAIVNCWVSFSFIGKRYRQFPQLGQKVNVLKAWHYGNEYFLDNAQNKTIISPSLRFFWPAAVYIIFTLSCTAEVKKLSSTIQVYF